MKIFLDDLYETERKSWIPEGYVGAKNFAEFKSLLEDALARGEKIEGLSFDNDLGEGEMDGWEIARWLTK
jgi:vacuolar-type H+-ATPase subunit I/STV1